MYYLIALPVIFLAWIVYIASARYNLKIFTFIAKLVIILSIIAFIYLFADYNGFNLIDFILEKLEFLFQF